MARKTWREKFETRKTPEIVVTTKDFGGIPAGSRMLIATPKIIEDYILDLPPGKVCDIRTLRNDLAAAHHVDVTCPLTTGIFLRIVAEANYEKLQQGVALDRIAPFWRVIDPGSPLAAKLTFGRKFLLDQIATESAAV